MTVAGQQAACTGGLLASDFLPSVNGICSFQLTESATPTVTSLSPLTASNGKNVTILGSGFSDSIEDTLVLFDDIQCDVTSSSSTSISCVLGYGRAGMKKLHLHILPRGFANTNNVTLEYEICVGSIHPNTSSLMGGIAVVILGSGFSTSDNEVWSHSMPREAYSFYKYLEELRTNDECTAWKTTVMIGSNECQVTAISEKQITCSAPSGEAGSSDVNVTVSCINGSSEDHSGFLSNGFTHDPSLTSAITSVSPTEGYGHGGEEVTITGTGFSTVNQENTVMVS